MSASGEVLSIISLPTYDPNLLDEEWENYIEADGDPFFNRALQGNYQLGSLSHTFLMTAAFLDNRPLDIDYANAGEEILLDDL